MPFITSPLASLKTLPSSRVSVRAISQPLALDVYARPVRVPAPGLAFSWPRNDACAASMARWTSSVVAAELGDHIVEICRIDVANEPRRLWVKPFAVDMRTGMHSDLTVNV
jgi:hypothetical protein